MGEGVNPNPTKFLKGFLPSKYPKTDSKKSPRGNFKDGGDAGGGVNSGTPSPIEKILPIFLKFVLKFLKIFQN